MMKRILFAAMMTTSVVCTAVPASATATANVYIQVAPPALRVETVPAPRHGYVWAPGYWNSHHNKYVWTSGRWMRERPGYQYHGSTWTEHDGHWSMQHGKWARSDRDHDGVPDRVDGHPDNPRRN